MSVLAHLFFFSEFQEDLRRLRLRELQKYLDRIEESHVDGSYLVVIVGFVVPPITKALPRTLDPKTITESNVATKKATGRLLSRRLRFFL